MRDSQAKYQESDPFSYKDSFFKISELSKKFLKWLELSGVFSLTGLKFVIDVCFGLNSLKNECLFSNILQKIVYHSYQLGKSN